MSGCDKAPPAWAVFLALACLYMLSIGRGFYTSDGDVMFQTTAALVERGTFALPSDPALPQIIAGADDITYYSKYDPGLPLLMVPFYAAGDQIGAINRAHRYSLAALAVLLVPALSAAGAVSLTPKSPLHFMERGLHTKQAPPLRAVERGSGGEAWIIVLAAGLATPLWVYGRVLFPEAVLALVLTAAVSVLASPPGPLSVRNGEGEQTGHESRQVLFPASGEGGKRHDVKSLSTCGEGCREGLRGEAFLAGLILGAGIAVRAALAIYALPLIGLIVWGGGSWKNRIGHAIPRVVAFGIGTLPGVALVLWFNAQRFDDPLRFGYTGEGFTTPPWKGLIGLLVSPGRGIFVYAPPLILSVILWPRFRRTAPALAWFLAGSWAVALAFYGTWWAWHGGWCWGPRFLVPLLPLSCLPLGVLPPGRMWRLAAVLLIAAGIAVQIPGVRVDLTPLYIAAFEAEGSPTTTDSPAYDTLNFDPAQSLLAGAIRRLADGHTETLALFHLRDSGLPPTWTTGAPLAVIVGLVIGVRGIIRRNGPGG